MHVQRGVHVLPCDQGRFYLNGERFTFHVGGMRFAIPHPDHPDKMILFGPENVTVLFRPEFQPDSAGAAAAEQSANP
jgi:hypothetical protein